MITKNIIAGVETGLGSTTIQAKNPKTNQNLPGDFIVATDEELDQACHLAAHAWRSYKHSSPKQRAEFLRTIASEIENLGDTLVDRVMLESGLPEGRVKGERGRTCSQLRMFADVVEDGSWVDAVIDEALPERKPMPRTDIRRMLIGVGPIAIFTASNFPLAFSTAGGDTASALAAGCPVIVKAHPSHLGTNALISEAISKAASQCDLPAGVYSSLIDEGRSIGVKLVQHPSVKAVAFTGSFNGGMALKKAADERPDPIPVFAEMGSVNPVFILPNPIASRSEELATQFANSCNMGAGQFCTNPGLMVLKKDEHTESFISQMKDAFSKLQPQTMLNQGICQNYEQSKKRMLEHESVRCLVEVSQEAGNNVALPTLASISGKEFLYDNSLQEEVFGPFSMLVICESEAEMYEVASTLNGQLSTTLIHEDGELENYRELCDRLLEKTGRLVCNGVPTGVEVGFAMQHGGPFPATTDARFTSVGVGGVKRFARPVSFQNYPQSMLPPALKDENPLGLIRTVNGKVILG